MYYKTLFEFKESNGRTQQIYTLREEINVKEEA